MAVVIDGRLADAVVSDAEGRFDTRVPARGGWALRVTKAGYAPVERAAPVPPAGDIEVMLPRGAVITGRVVDPGGDPMAGATVRVQCAAACPALPRSGTFVVETDDLGVYRVGSLPAGRYAIDLLPSELAREGSPALALPDRGTSIVPAADAQAGPGRRRPPRRSFSSRPDRRACCTSCPPQRTSARRPGAQTRLRCECRCRSCAAGLSVRRAGL